MQQIQNVSFYDDMADLKNFEKQQKIELCSDNWKYFSNTDLIKGTKNIAKSSKKPLSEFTIRRIYSFYNEVDISLKLNHPLFPKYIGYNLTNFKNKPNPIILYECSFRDILQNKYTEDDFNDTNKLITLFGIASGMSYLHSHNILHRKMSIYIILFDDLLYPKIMQFDNAIQLPQNLPFKDTSLKDQFKEYIAPEVLTKFEYSKASDVYSFALIMYQVVYKKEPEIYENVFSEMIPYMTINGERPKFDEPINDAYRNLIERCWSQDPKLRPSFDEIVDELKTNPEFITENVNEAEYRKYIKFIEDYPTSFKDEKTKIILEELMKLRGHTFQKSFIDIKSRGPNFTGNELDLTKYALKDLKTKKIEYSLSEIHFSDKDKMKELQSKGMSTFYTEIDKYTEKYFAEIYSKEINLFYRHEIVNFSRKLNALSQINHPAILNFIGYSSIDFNGKLNPVIVTEYCNITLDKNCIHPYKDDEDSLYWNETKKLINIYGIAHAMKYLHEHNIIHRDLKPDNVAQDEMNYPKLTGFNVCKFLTDDETISKNKSKKIKGTPAYIAPEVYANGEYSKSSDVYSFGLVMYEIVTGLKPFEECRSPNEIKELILNQNKRPIIEDFINPAYRDMIERCWTQEPTQRPTFDEIVSELKTNPKFITNEIDKEDYFEYIEYVDEFPTKFDTSKRIKQFDNIIKSRLHTFDEMDPYFSIDDMYDTETNDLLLDYDYFNANDYLCEDRFGIGMSYRVELRIHQKTEELNIHKTIPNDYEYLTKDEIINYSRELNIIIKLNHPSILKFIGYSQRYRSYYYPRVVVEYAPKGTLFRFLEQKSEDDDWNDTKKLINIYGIAHAMKYLHEHNIIHRDLKTENVVLDDSLNPKLTGFNISMFLTDDETISKNKSKKIKGTPAYIAPEVYANGEYSKSSDVYSFGLVMYEIVTGLKPFEECRSPNEIKELILNQNKRPIIEDFINPAYRDMIERCWTQELTQRPTFDEIVSELKTNPKFITNEIDKEEYQKYIRFIEESPISFDSSKHISQFDYKIKSRNCGIDLQKNAPKINFRYIYKTELNEILFNYDYLNMNDYKKQKLIHSCYKYKLYEVLNTKTQKTCLAIRFSDEFERLLGEQRVKFIQRFNNNLKLNHPCILKYVGYSPLSFKNKPHPTIITEHGSNGTLKSILNIDMKNQSEVILNETQRLIIMYGIASAMSYLHSQNLIYCKLKPMNVFLDEFLFPKINGFFISKEKSENPIPNISQMYFNTAKCNVDDDIYIPPEKYLYNSNSTARDVYAYSMILYQLVTNEEPFSEFNYEIIQQICENKLRPKFKDTVPECYRKLIEKCWSGDPIDRPSFDEILYHLKTNPEFVNERINKEEYFSYIDFIEESNANLNITQFDDFIKTKNKTFRKVEIDLNKLRSPARLDFSVNFGSIDLNNFEKQNKIGSGGFGVVYKVHKKDTENDYAAKVSIYEVDQCDDDTIINLTREIDIISNLNHSSILQYIGFSPHNFKSKPKPIIVTEYASNGSLDKILEMERNGIGKYEWDDTKKLINIYGIAAGMAYLHKQDILHRDLKPGNILLDDNLYPKIADFGLSKVLSEEDDVECKRKRPKSSGFKGTYAYCAPEIIEKHVYTKEGDVYAYAMIVYEIITGEVLYENLNIFQLIHKVCNGYRPEFKYPIPYCYRKLIENCWEKSNRPTFEQIAKIIETNKDFITSNVDEDEFLDYISLIKDDENSIIVKIDNQQTQTQQQNDKPISNENSVGLKRIVETEEEEEKEENQENELFLDLSKFEKQEIINKGDCTKLYKFKEIETGKIFSGQMSMQKVHKITKKESDELSKELEIIKKMKHPSLLSFVGFSLIDFKKENKPVIVTEYASNGSLFDILEVERINKSIPEWNDTKKLINIYGIASAMSYLHSHDIIHRSLKPSTIYLDEILTPKIGDFGLSTRFTNSENITHQSITAVKATPLYSAPEVLKSNEYTKSSDVYAFAFIVYEIMTNEVPFNDLTNQNQIFNEVVNKQNRPKFNKKIPDVYRKLIENCWCQDPSERPSFDEIVYHLKVDERFVTSSINNDDYQRYINFIDKQINKKTDLQKVQENEC